MTDEQIENEVEEAEDSVETESEESEWTPPGREEWEKLDKIARARKKERDDARRELLALKEKSGDEPKPEVAEAHKWRLTAARSSAASAIQAAGFPGDVKTARLLANLIPDLKNAEPDEAGDFDFEDAIDELRERLPMLFAKEKAAVSNGRRPTTADRGGRSPAESAQERHVRELMKRAGY